MADTNSISITALMKYFSNEHKSVSRGENHHKSGHVLTFSYSDGMMFGKVQASTKNNEYSVKIYLDDALDIQKTTCECPRGSYKCSHAVALFLHALDNLSRTDTECQWKKKRQADDTTKTAEELFPVKMKYDPLSRAVTDDDRSWFYSQLSGCGQFTGLQWLMQPEPRSDFTLHHLPLVDNILHDPCFLSFDDKTNYFFEKMKVSVDYISTIACLTKGQNSNASWHLVRKGRLTASNFGSVLFTKKISQALVKRILGGKFLQGVKSVAWGLNHEKEAIEYFSAKLGITVEETGVWLDETGLLGASPDGLVGEDGVVEIKCAYSHRDNILEDCIKDTKFCLEFVDGQYYLKKNHIYWHQVQGQLYLTKRKFCYFVVWTLRFCHYLIIAKDETWKEN